jgi:archaetidylinositol phosphate synthase
MSETVFRDARRELTSLTAVVEKRVLLWLAARMPARVNSDHLTLLGLLAMVAAGGAYALAADQPAWLHVVNALLLVNWFGDSLDGTLARHRNRSRPRYGFYVDHMVDTLGVLALMAGLAVSGYMSVGVAVAIVIAYYLLSINIYLATYTLGVFKIAYGRFGGTELRILMALGNLALLASPTVTVMGRPVLLYDLCGIGAAGAMLAALAVSCLRNTRELFRLEKV